MNESFENPKAKQAGRVDIELPLKEAPDSGAKPEDPTMPAELREHGAERKQPSTQERLTQQHAERLSIIQMLREGQELARPLELTEEKPLPPVLKTWISNTVEQIKGFSLYAQTKPEILRMGLEDMCYHHTWDKRIAEHSAALMEIMNRQRLLDASPVSVEPTALAGQQADAAHVQELLDKFAHDSKPMPLPASPSAVPPTGDRSGAGAGTGWFDRFKKWLQ